MFLCDFDSRTVNTRAITGLTNSFGPGKDVPLLLGQHATTLFLVEENHASLSKPFGFGCMSGLTTIRCTWVTDRLQLGIRAAVI
jgi:hypothetical protein